MPSVNTLSAASVLAMGPIVPVVVLHHLADALPLAEAVLNGGIKVLEITLRTPVALKAIDLLRERLAEACVGAGTVVNGRQLQQCIEAGAQFAISPGSTTELLQAGLQSQVPLIPGVSSVSEMMEGMNCGYSHFKFFPAEAAGGIPMLKAISAPFPDLRFCPTGGIHAKNYLDYLTLANVECVGGSWVVPDEAIKQKNWSLITDLCSTALEKASHPAAVN
ncbi:keto-deoxy-phosphogluconate aldolase [Legionella taurinensis]|uniref:2-dehydro-3-deoxy-phosphogluconate aldolase n=1 Tax=Legionella taurinensis TaxID=70611 RepID=A0A3A5L368_9GAMM|nr:bifunctional 4-hydroxy-2-oxoglutarate aldolase/2-dehydro-3-deoxy-phosphogluconate aldolase [Legionella taurinensis]MDX1837175.1 bifunctional 4-hydroxy-2-oxoglutarate aldolase/2-dehydro-3-deoxy-phosphogluconate aldolase [Legionella taurinensis]PUT40349.1 keto-deoxy-phosphogluconate aldolase [Legionella taurinensis]PUT41584.1 keto-deoxy-phosphogluconate aldolase [Legionella taurinensis]PUT44449.1 keto-deoxy-phosphogluconate aldolase [Legionella taurinensis]PUT48411.1 keto-deoxy-phosphoglucona